VISLFLPEFLLKFAENLDSFRSHAFLLFFPWLDGGNADGFKQTGAAESLPFTKKIKNMMLETVSKLDGTQKKLLFYQIKSAMEDYYYWRFPSTEYEMSRLANSSNLEMVTVQAECNNCKVVSPFTINLEQMLARHIGSMDKSRRLSCPKCSKENSCQLLTILDNE
jgi:hypothetical protein